MRLSWVFLVILAFESGAQTPLKSAWLTWPDLKVVVTPDTSGETLIWLTVDSASAREPGGRFFFGALDPRSTQEWVKDVRVFVKQGLSKRDTGQVRTSTTLRAKNGEQLYFVRRRYAGQWTHELFLVFADSAGRAPALVEMDVRLREVLDTLERVARRTPRRQIP